MRLHVGPWIPLGCGFDWMPVLGGIKTFSSNIRLTD